MSIVYIHKFLVIYTFHLTYFIWLYAASLSPYRMGPDSSRIFERVCFLSLLTSLLHQARVSGRKKNVRTTFWLITIIIIKFKNAFLSASRPLQARALPSKKN